MVFIEVFVGLTTIVVVSVNLLLVKKMCKEEKSSDDRRMQVYGPFPARFAYWKQMDD